MTVRFERIAVLGLGLLGGSLALAARRAGVVGRVVGAARRRGPLEQALRDGVIDEIADAPTAVEGADLVVLSTPVGVMAPLLQSVASRLADGAIVTDVGSVKGVLGDQLPGLLPPGASYVGSHPMAGSHLRGAAHARADLFDGAACAITPLPGGSSEAVEKVKAFWRALGARIVVRDPETHDAEVAWTSHVPHAMAFAFARALGKAPSTSGELAGGGFRDFTRIARSDAELWGDILRANAKALAGPLRDCGEALAQIAQRLEEGDTDALEQILGEARQNLAELEKARSGGEDPEIQTASTRPDGNVDRSGKTKGGHQEKQPTT